MIKMSSKKPTVVFIYGYIAVGKLTIARILSKKLGYKLIHNHHINDFVNEIFDFKSDRSEIMKDHLRYYVLEHAVKEKINFISTHCYNHDFISKGGLSDPKYVRTQQRKLEKWGARFCPVFIKADRDKLMQRVSDNSRKEFLKLTNKKIMKDLLNKDDTQNHANLKNTLVIDNTNLSANTAANLIIKHFKLKKRA